MAHFIFMCPATSLNVQHQLDGDPDIFENEYEGTICPACTRLHFINRKTGKVLGQDDEMQPQGCCSDRSGSRPYFALRN
jgi:hypothetical protein